ncbi:hypothetical protein ACLKA6_012814 [Drosophila palustris]
MQYSEILNDHGVPIDEDAGIQQLRSIVKGVVGNVDGSQRKEYEKEVGREVESKLNSGCESKSVVFGRGTIPVSCGTIPARFILTRSIWTRHNSRQPWHNPGEIPVTL